MTFIHVTYAECLRVLCGNQGGTANFSFVPNQGRSFFCNRKVFLLQKKPTGQDTHKWKNLRIFNIHIAK